MKNCNNTSGQNGKGDSPRPVKKSVWDKNYDAIFRKKKRK